MMFSQQEKGNLFAFTNAVSPSNSTTVAEKNTFSCNVMAQNQMWYESPIFPTLFKRAGYDVYFWDIQRDFATNAVFTFSVNSFLFDEEISKLSYTEVNEKTFKFDGELVQDLFSESRDKSRRNLYILHFLGQHVSAEDRFPHTKEFVKFTRNDIKSEAPFLTEAMKDEIAMYDNATYYNDWVVGEIMERFADKNAVMVYLSDHGEEIYDYRPSKGRNANPMTSDVLKYQFEVPFVIWCSDQYKSNHPEIISEIRSALDKPFTTDLVSQILFRLSGIKTTYYNSENDVLSRDYVSKKRIVGDKFDFDKIRQQ